MSAITGFCFFDGRPAAPGVLDAMLQTQTHRGPDGSGAWCEGSVALGHRMLFTTPESLRETLPLKHRERDLTITADVRLDNRNELLSALRLSSVANAPITDSALILAAYAKWGEVCVEKLLGDWAFAIWDGEKQRMFCARDHFGAKPFYYHQSPRAFVFASEIKAILQVPDVPRRLDELRVAYLLDGVTEDEEITFYRDIRRLPPAQSMVVSRKEFRHARYWNLDASREIRCTSQREYSQMFREVFAQAVGDRLRSAMPVGSMLSGGLDSSAIVCMARDIGLDSGASLPVFSARDSDRENCRESRFMDAVIRQGGLMPFEINSAQATNYVGDLESTLVREDEPLDAATMYLPRIVYRAAQNAGMRVLLDGVDGDIITSQPSSHYPVYLLRAGKWRAAFHEVRIDARNSKMSALTFLRNNVIRPLLPSTFLQIYRSLRRRDPASETNNLLHPEFAARVGLRDHCQALRGGDGMSARNAREEHRRYVLWGHIADAMERYDRAAATFSIEPRHPFFDKRLAEFCVALPMEQKRARGKTKMILRRGLRELLPPEVRQRTWNNGPDNLSRIFGIPLIESQAALMEDVIQNDLHILEPYVNLEEVRSAHRRQRAGLQDGVVWQVTTLALWLQRHGLVR